MPERLPYAVEPMALADVDQVMAIEKVAFSAPWSARAYRYEIVENDYSTMLVVRPATGPVGAFARLARQVGLIKPGPVLGYGGFWLLVDDAHVATIAVHPDWHRRGLGELLLLSLLERAIAQDASRATLEVRVSNQPAQGLYHKYGFEVVSLRKRYYADNDEDALIMATPHLVATGFQENLGRCRAELYARLSTEKAANAVRSG
jgi:ribosomal-protein-alanine N-acetyltransferase